MPRPAEARQIREVRDMREIRQIGEVHEIDEVHEVRHEMNFLISTGPVPLDAAVFNPCTKQPNAFFSDPRGVSRTLRIYFSILPRSISVILMTKLQMS